jgi:hypothetical protein
LNSSMPFCRRGSSWASMIEVDPVIFGTDV